MELRTGGKRILVALSILALAACGRTEKLTDAEAQAQADAEARGALYSAQLRLLGTNAGDLEHLFLAARDLEVTAAGARVFVEPGDAIFDLAETSNAFLAGRFDVPEGVESLHIKLWLDDFGAFESAGGSGEVAARGAPIELDAPVASLDPRKHVVLQLDLGRSLAVRGPEARVLVPAMTVAY
jgi:hypothetical protein